MIPLDFQFPVPGELLWMKTFPGRVYPLSRPRFSKGHAYQPLENQRELRAWMKEEKLPETLKEEIWVDSYFLFNSRREPDKDNCLKAVFDAMQHSGLIDNDRKIVGGSFVRGFSKTPSATFVIRKVIYHDSSSLSDGRV